MNRCFLSALTLLLISPSVSFVDAEETIPDFIGAVQKAGVPPCLSCDSAGQGLQGVSKEKTPEHWNMAGFRNAQLETWSEGDIYPAGVPTESKFTHNMSITTVVFRGSNWTKEEVLKRFRRFATIFSQCNIKVQRVEVVEADAPNGWIDVDGWARRAGDRETEIAKALPSSIDRPVFLYVRSSKDGSFAFAQPKFYVGESSPVLDTIWMTAAVKGHEETAPPSSSTEAHELGHVLGDCNHVDDGSANFLAGIQRLLNDQIRKDQCEAMKRHRSVKPI